MKINWFSTILFGIIFSVEGAFYLMLTPNQKPFAYTDGLFLLSQLFFGIACITVENKKS